MQVSNSTYHRLLNCESKIISTAKALILMVSQALRIVTIWLLLKLCIPWVLFVVWKRWGSRGCLLSAYSRNWVLFLISKYKTKQHTTLHQVCFKMLSVSHNFPREVLRCFGIAQIPLKSCRNRKKIIIKE